ncbi:hypothetical protein [Cohnella abietis]|nr:hypothetical protein [Cohnella abietis]
MSWLTNRIVLINDKWTTYFFLRTPAALLGEIWEERCFFTGYKMSEAR